MKGGTMYGAKGRGNNGRGYSSRAIFKVGD